MSGGTLEVFLMDFELLLELQLFLSNDSSCRERMLILSFYSVFLQAVFKTLSSASIIILLTYMFTTLF